MSHKVFSIFSSLGGSSLGYKRAGCDVIGGCEIDKKFANFYVKKFNPQHMIIDDARVLLEKDFDFLYDLDIMDGSPPCTLFSIANLKADLYKGKERKFKEGQKSQALDDLVSVYAKIVKKYQPKYFVMENVPGLANKKNVHYLNEFCDILKDYYMETGIVNSANLGLPQSRNRLFVIGRKNYKLGNILKFPTPPRFSVYGDIEEYCDKELNKDTKTYQIWLKCESGKKFSSVMGDSYFNYFKLSKNKTVPTITTNPFIYHYKFYRRLTKNEIHRAFGLPDNYLTDLSARCLGYIVPPIFYEKIIPRLLQD